MSPEENSFGELDIYDADACLTHRLWPRCSGRTGDLMTPAQIEIAASLTELDIEALKGTMGAWDSETCERLRQLKLGDGHRSDFHITDLGRAILVLKITKSLSEEALEQIYLLDYACAPEMDPLEYDSDTLPKCARELYDAGCIEIISGCIDEVWPTDLGRAVAAEL